MRVAPGRVRYRRPVKRLVGLAIAGVTAVSLAWAQEPSPGWTEVTPGAGPSPPGRYFHAMAYDEARDRVVLFGGHDGTTALDDTWEWDPEASSWTLVQSADGAAPPASWTHAMSYDAARGRVVLLVRGSVETETWEWDGAIWEDRTGTGASPEEHAWPAMAYDTGRERVISFGGAADVATDSTREWDGTSWTTLVPVGPVPHARNNHVLAADPVRGNVLLFGGIFRSPLGNLDFDDLWEWDGAALTWTDLQAIEGGPAAQGQDRPAGAVDSARGRLVLVSTYLGSDTWEYDLATGSWSATVPTLMAVSGIGLAGSAAAYDERRSVILLFGGRRAAGAASEEFPARTFEYRASGDLAPPPTPAAGEKEGGGCGCGTVPADRLGGFGGALAAAAALARVRSKRGRSAG